MDYPKTVSILLPSAFRPTLLKSALDALFDSVGNRRIEVLVSTVSTDIESRKIALDYDVFFHVRTVAEYHLGAVYAWNKLAEYATGAYLALWADDLVPQYGWLDKSLAALEHHALVGFNDLSSDGNEYAAHWIAKRSFILAEMGGVMYPPMYRSWWADREVTDKAKAGDMYAWAREAVVEHNHYTFGKSQIDCTYQEAIANYDADYALYLERKSQGYPINYEASVR